MSPFDATARFRPGDLVRFRRGRVAHIVGRIDAGRLPRTACGMPVTLEDQAGTNQDPFCRSCEAAPVTRRPLRRPTPGVTR